MTGTFNLSSKAVRDLSSNPIPNYYWEKDVKEFIKILKEYIKFRHTIKTQTKFHLYNKINTLAGDDLK